MWSLSAVVEPRGLAMVVDDRSLTRNVHLQRRAVLPALERRIVLVTGSPLCRNPRVVKEATALGAAGYDVTVLRPILSEALRALDAEIESRGLWTTRTTVDLTAGGVRSVTARLERRAAMAIVQHARWPSPAALGYGVRASLRLARALDADLTIGHQEVGLAVVDRLAREGCRTGVDLEDWYSEDLLPEDRVGRPVDLLRRLEHAAVRRGGAVTTTSQALADALASASGGPAPAVLYNVFPFSDRATIDGERRDRPADDARPSVHWVSQTIGPGRGLDALFAALRDVHTPVAVHLRGALSEADREWVYGSFPADAGHGLYTHPLVPPTELLSRIAEHDIGLALEACTPRSRDLTVTNKLFHYLLGGLAVVATDTAGQREIARLAPDGIFLCRPETPQSLAAALDRLVADPDLLGRAKAAALAAAESKFCWERQESILLEQVERVVTTTGASRVSRSSSISRSPQQVTAAKTLNTESSRSEPSLCVIVHWFGPLPAYATLFFETCRSNPTIDFLIVGDTRPPEGIRNVRHVFITIDEWRSKAEESLETSVRVADAYKICDIRPACGIIWKSELAGYDFWAAADMDVVWGDIRTVATANRMFDADVSSVGGEQWLSGAFTMIRNTDANNKLYVASPSYQEIFSDGRYLGFDESCGRSAEDPKSVGRLLLDGKRISFTDVVFDSEKKGEITVAVPVVIAEPGLHAGWYQYKWAYGSIKETSSGNEALLVHLLFPKNEPAFTLPSWSTLPPSFIISPSGVHTGRRSGPLAPLQEVAAVFATSVRVFGWWNPLVRKRLAPKLRQMGLLQSSSRPS